MRERRTTAWLALSAATFAAATATAAESTDAALGGIVVTATRIAEPSSDIPASIDRVEAEAHAARSTAGESVGSLDHRAGGVRSEPPELRPGFAVVGAGIRGALEFRRARRAPVRRWHSRHDAGWPGTVFAVRFGLRRTISRYCAGRSRRCMAIPPAACIAIFTARRAAGLFVGAARPSTAPSIRSAML